LCLSRFARGGSRITWIKIMSRTTVDIRAILRGNPYGQLVSQIAEAVGRSEDAVRKVLKRMPDAYIYDWAWSGAAWAQIWCVVVPPPNEPKPVREGGKKAYQKEYMKTYWANRPRKKA